MRIQYLNGQVILSNDQTRYVFDENTGALLSAERGGKTYGFGGVMIDAGLNERFTRGQNAFDSLDNKRTWELPAIRPTLSRDKAVFQGCQEDDGRLMMVYETAQAQIIQRYDMVGNALRVTAKVKSRSKERLTVNSVAFFTYMDGMDGTFEFPTNAPCDVFETAQMAKGQAVECGLVGSMTHLTAKDKKVNVLFLDTAEKWSQGAYRTDDHTVCAYIPAVECWLDEGESFEVGSLYIEPIAAGDPYIAMRDFFAALGYLPATDGIREGVLYSCHPSGTMDAGFDAAESIDLYEYAKQLPAIKELGVDHLWILPIFEHLDRGVYHPTDQSIIDKRYGGEEAMRFFADACHRLNINLLFDYVPHGPAPSDPLAKENPQWCSLRRDGTQQEEWDCVSFDMADPRYLRYTSDMVNGHVRRFKVDGARIDCAMGGLSNWRPYGENRPSHSNLYGGVQVSAAIKRGFQEMGQKALILPENFNPVPAYYPVTDVFYGMNLYRAIFVLEEQKVDAQTFASRLTHFLSVEHRAMPPELKKLRFLGNHDTVSWVWQKRRAFEVYGNTWAKAMFALMAFIDGVPMIYQGDEDPAMANKQGENLRDFFKKLYSDRKKWVGEGTDIEYLDAQNGVMAFIRHVEGKKRLVLISMSGEDAVYHTPLLEKSSPCLYGMAAQGDRVTLKPYGFEIFELN